MAYKLSFETTAPPETDENTHDVASRVNPHPPLSEAWLAENARRADARAALARKALNAAGYADDILDNGTLGPAMLRGKIQEIADLEDRQEMGSDATPTASNHDTFTGHPPNSYAEQEAAAQFHAIDPTASEPHAQPPIPPESSDPYNY